MVLPALPARLSDIFSIEVLKPDNLWKLLNIILDNLNNFKIINYKSYIFLFFFMETNKKSEKSII